MAFCPSSVFFTWHIVRGHFVIVEFGPVAFCPDTGVSAMYMHDIDMSGVSVCLPVCPTHSGRPLLSLN